jgi:hypothetical protein
VGASQRIAVCVANRGARRVAVYGNADAAARTSTAVKGGRRLGVDMSVVFERDARSLASQLPVMLSRAALFRLAGFGAWGYVVLGALLLAASWLLLRALESALSSGVRGPRRSAAPRG